MMLKSYVAVSLMAAAVAAIPISVRAQEVPAEYQQVLSTLGKQGDFKDNVLKVNIPRNDVKVTVAGVSTPTPFGFGGWVAMTKGDGGHQVLMGDLVLLQDEVNPVMSALLDNGFDVTALHNHFFRDEPRMYFMHVHGHGTAADLAQKLKPALALIGKSTGEARRHCRRAGRTDWSRLQVHAAAQRSESRRDGCADQRADGSEHLGGVHRDERQGSRRRRRGDARKRSDAGTEGPPQERSRRRRDSSPHDSGPAHDHLPPLLGDGSGGQARDWIQSRSQRARETWRRDAVATRSAMRCAPPARS
jgi:hypothetical protein